MNGIRVQRATTLFMTAEVDFWVKYFACWGRSLVLTRAPPPADFSLTFFHVKPFQGIHIILTLVFFIELLLLFLCKLET